MMKLIEISILYIDSWGWEFESECFYQKLNVNQLSYKIYGKTYQNIGEN